MDLDRPYNETLKYVLVQLRKMTWWKRHIQLDALAFNRPRAFTRIINRMSPDECLYGLSTGSKSDGTVIVLKDKPGNKRNECKLRQKSLHDYFQARHKKQVTLYKYFKPTPVNKVKVNKKK